MNPFGSRHGLRQYTDVGAHGLVTGASPYELVLYLLDGALARIADGRRCLGAGRIGEKCEHLRRALAIVDGLRLALDRERGGAIAGNLDALYDYIGRRLVQANAGNDAGMLEEIAGLLREIRGAWDAIAPQRTVPHGTGGRC